MINQNEITIKGTTVKQVPQSLERLFDDINRLEILSNKLDILISNNGDRKVRENVKTSLPLCELSASINSAAERVREVCDKLEIIEI
jgi:hypothetical protein